MRYVMLTLKEVNKADGKFRVKVRVSGALAAYIFELIAINEKSPHVVFPQPREKRMTPKGDN